MEARNSRQPAFQVIFIVCGVWLIGLGLYFMFLRPALLPEDLRYIGLTIQEIQSAVPGLVHWLHRVFTVMGGFMMGAGALVIALMIKDSKRQRKLTLAALALAGISTVGTMSLTNFLLSSDFKWILLAPFLLWLVGLVLYARDS